NDAAMGAHGHFDEGDDVAVTATGGERPTAVPAVPLRGRHVGGLVAGRQVVVAAAAVAGAAALLAAVAWRRCGRGGAGRVGAGGGQDIGVVMAFVAAAVQALFEQADFGFEFVDALLQLALALLPARLPVEVPLGEALLQLHE